MKSINSQQGETIIIEMTNEESGLQLQVKHPSTPSHTDTHNYRAKMLGHRRRRRRVSTWSLSPSLSSLSISRNFYTHMERKLNYPQQIDLAGTKCVCVCCCCSCCWCQLGVCMLACLCIVLSWIVFSCECACVWVCVRECECVLLSLRNVKVS